MIPEESAPDDSVGKGVLYAVLCQLGIIVGLAVAMFLVQSPTLFLGLTIWGLAQWVVLTPLYIWRMHSGRPLIAKGILITGMIGVLLNAGCAALMWPGMRSMWRL